MNSLNRSNYLKHISNIMEGTITIVKNIHVNSSHVLIHCSDGWDRTSQVAALAQLCLDPYFRTLKGFAVLIEKEFLSFGHKFNQRYNHINFERRFYDHEFKEDEGGIFKRSSTSNQKVLLLKEISPIFLQFLDCVYQLQLQFENRFEFNTELLKTLLKKVYDCQCSSFLFDSEKQRYIVDPLEGKFRKNCVSSSQSVWDQISLNDKIYVNENYDKILDDKSKGDMGVLIPSSKNLKYWFELYGYDLSNENLTEEEGKEDGQLNKKSSSSTLISSIDSPLSIWQKYQSSSQYQNGNNTESIFNKFGGYARGLSSQVQSFSQNLVQEFEKAKGNEINERIENLTINDDNEDSVPPKLRQNEGNNVNNVLFDVGEDDVNTVPPKVRNDERLSESLQKRSSESLKNNIEIQDTNQAKDPLGVAFI